jgi:hypothetical protein
MEVDIEMPLSDEQKHRNFLKILGTVRYLDDGGRITEDWMVENTNLIIMYREWISDYSQVNEEISEPTFRKCCVDTETLLRQLCHSIQTRKTFDLKIYHMFMQKMKQIVEAVISDDELSDLLSIMSM